MKDIILDDQFQFLLPELDEETYRNLEASILEHGLLFPLVLWNGVLIDGYNRYKICLEHDIPITTINMEFDSREDVVIWIIENQISRRNLTPMQLSYFRGLHYNADKNVHGDIKRVSRSGANALNNASSHFENLRTGSTARRLSEHYNVSQNTIIRNSKLAAGLTAIGEINSDVKRQILSGGVRVGKNRLESLASASTDKIEALVEEIESGEFVSRAPRMSSDVKLNLNTDVNIPELKQLNNIISGFAVNFNSMFQQISNGNSSELKPVLRTFINELEELYNSMDF